MKDYDYNDEYMFKADNFCLTNKNSVWLVVNDLRKSIM
jgi:hypothetical protein